MDGWILGITAVPGPVNRRKRLFHRAKAKNWLAKALRRKGTRREEGGKRGGHRLGKYFLSSILFDLRGLMRD